MKNARFIPLFIALTLLPASLANAADGPADLYAESRMTMHHNMNVEPTGNADYDFAANMLPHHQGAVDMAKVELEHGKDPELRKLAQDIITSQEKEIAFMKKWLAEHPSKK